MIDRLSPKARRDQYGTKINRDHSPLLIYGIPWLTIIVASLTPMLPVIASAPVLPPLGFIVFLAWQLVRPGLLPFWAGIPLGLWDDLFSGQPIGSAIMLWSLTLLALEVIETRFPWRGFWLDWLTASLLLLIYIVATTFIAGIVPSLHMVMLIVPMIAISILIYPFVARIISALDRLRLLRLRVLS